MDHDLHSLIFSAAQQMLTVSIGHQSEDPEAQHSLCSCCVTPGQRPATPGTPGKLPAGQYLERRRPRLIHFDRLVAGVATMLRSLTAFACAMLLVLTCLGMSSVFNPRRARVAIDYGPRIIGIARSNYFGVVEPYGTIRNKGNLTDLSVQVLTLAKMWSASEVIIGIPLDSDGKMHHAVRNLNGRLCLNFSTVLNTIAHIHTPNTPLTTMLFDERYTTKEAKLRLSQERKKASLDAMSAACILERYLEDAGEGAILAQLSSYPLHPDLAVFDYDVVRQYVRKMHYSDPQRPNNDHMNRMKMGMRRRKAVVPAKKGGDGDVASISSIDSMDSMDSNDASAELSTLSAAVDASGETGETGETLTLGLEVEREVDWEQEQDQELESEPEVQRELTEAELQQLEYEQVRALRRKKGTLKRKL
jgi:putative transcription antitermination factor YqgF